MATTSATSVTASRPGQPDDLHRHPAGGERIGHRRGVGVAPHQHRRRRHGRPRIAGLVVAPGDVVGHPVAFGLDVGQQRAPDRARFGARPRPQRLHRHRPAPGLGRHRVGQIQRPRRIAPAGAQLQRRRGAAVRAGKVGGEPRQVGRRRPAPAVDRLDRVADGGQRELVVDSAAEQRRQRDPLGVAGVLVLVEQHHPEASPQLLADLRERRRQPGRRRPSACRSPSPSRRACAGAARRSAAPARCARSGWPASAAATGWDRGRADTDRRAACARAAPARRGCRSAGRCRRGARPADPPAAAPSW